LGVSVERELPAGPTWWAIHTAYPRTYSVCIKILLVPHLFSVCPSTIRPSLVESQLLPGFSMPVFSRLAVAVQLFSIIFTPTLAASTPQNYDYVIVGGGITGLVVANRLTEDKNGKLLHVKSLLMRQSDKIRSKRACD
jgi:hypothetical protein